MKEFIEKQIKRLEELSIPIYDSDREIENKVVFTDIAKNIVNELAEEYKGGWIPCSERLPEVATCYLVTEEVIVNSKKQYVTDIRLFGTEDEWLCPSNRKIIAWQPLPPAYKEEGE